jgi:tungstate transport system substrate-binding protein
MERMKKTALAEVIGSILAGGREGKMEILAKMEIPGQSRETPRGVSWEAKPQKRGGARGGCMISTLQTKSVVQVGLLILLVHLAACFSAQEARAQTNVVRLAVVNTPAESGLLDEILADFERQKSLRVEVYSGSDAILRARNGQADLIISHYGHADLESFMEDGLGQWPRPVFSNQNAIIGPSSDPAHVSNLEDAVEAFRRIAQSKSPYVVNNAPVPKFTEDVLWEAAGRPPKEAWYVDLGLNEQSVAQAAAQRGAYFIWGLVPFLQYLRQNPGDLRPLVLNDSFLNRMMTSVVVKPEKFPQANVEGAKALERYLLLPSTQARVKVYRYPGLDHALWWPRGRDNSAANMGYEGDLQPAITAAGIVNAADRRAGIAPGTIVEIYGTNLALDTCIADTLPWPAQLACSPTRVAVGSRNAPLHYVSPNQINAQIPPDLGLGSVNVTVFRGVVRSNTVPITLVR